MPDFLFVEIKDQRPKIISTVPREQGADLVDLRVADAQRDQQLIVHPAQLLQSIKIP